MNELFDLGQPAVGTKAEVVDGMCPNCLNVPEWYNGACTICWWRPGQDLSYPHYMKPGVWAAMHQRRSEIGKEGR